MQDCLPLLERISNKVEDWKNRFLSHAGHIELMKVVLALLMQSLGTKVPISVLSLNG